MKISFIVPNRNQSLAYPLIKWKKEFKNKGIIVNVTNRIQFSSKSDIYIVSSKFYRAKHNSNDEFLNKVEDDVRSDAEKLKSKGKKIIYFDAGDATGCRELAVINYVDLYLKKQLYKDRFVYLNNQHKYRPWLSNDRKCNGCIEQHFHKIQLGWNLAYTVYTNWNFNPNRFGLFYLKPPSYNSPATNRSITASYRGKMGGARSPQRKAIMEALMTLNKKNSDSFITGSVISKKKYIKEINNSKALVSPFGYGEICYRDMEAFIHGCILVKPDMEHIETFPNVFIKNETYIPTKWDLTDLKDILLEIDKDYSNYHNIAQKGQEVFKEYYTNFDIFYEHFNSILNKLNK
jgi:hypothetical protein